ncbi:NAD(P)-dependent oxidoreductase [Cohaesibacter celericrescens]|uniref:2-hydroxy-3-oxopropionate reductase n=1 Tax=Cohaesibacter celericrescens TaxID=2067669 RepID=A0A2N5XRJ0_9HYPH|nr:NAD(P)-dependent oxidoreductase [Cohaesibacter celericrescens]PLW77057.1 2-hydroxy-3-oxopropionate reductase [Cohaesibacter celericrescens]
MKIALLGTGLMGSPMAKNLAASGHEMHLWNRTFEVANNLQFEKSVHLQPADAVKDADVVISMLYDGPVTSKILIDEGVIDATPKGGLIINMASVEPWRDRKHAEAIIDQGKLFFEAPVSGGVKGAEDGTLTIFGAGNDRALYVARPLLEVLGRLNFLGDYGAGQSAKLANQLIVAITIGAVAEAFKLAESAGCDAATLRDSLRGGFADSRILELHGERMVKRDWEPGGRSKSQLKDLVNAMAVANESNLDLPLASCIEAGFRNFIEDFEGGELDHSAYYLWLEKRSAL